MSLNVYLFFDGTCREAFEFYRSVFGGEFEEFVTYASGSPDGIEVPDAERDRIMHVSLPVGPTMLMGNDSCSVFGAPPVVGSNLAISITGQSKEHCDDIFTRLSEGGTVEMPMEEMFWGGYFGSWQDRFGIRWMINYQMPEA